MINPSVKLLVGATAIGFAPIFAKLLILDGAMSPFASGFWRMFIGAVGFYLMLMMSGRWSASVAELQSLRNNSWFTALLAGLLFAADLMAWHTSFLFTSVGASSLIANLSAVLVPISGVIFFREKLKPHIIVGGSLALLGLVGLTLLKSGQINGSRLYEGREFLGELLAFLTAFFYTGYMLSIKSLAGKYSARVLMFTSSTVSALILGLACFSLGQSLIPATGLGWLWAICLGVLSQVVGQGLVASSLAVLPVGQSALILLWAPISSTVFGWLILGEAMNLGQVLSVILTVSGIAIVVRR